MANIYDLIGTKLANKVIRIGKLSVTIKTALTADEYASAVSLIVNSCFTDDGYAAEYKELAKRYVYLKYFTDIDLSDITVNELYGETQADWYGKIMAQIIDTSAYYDIEKAVEDAIQYRICVRQTAFDKLCSDLSAIMTANQKDNLADVSALLDKLGGVDKETFVKEAVKQSVAKNKVGDKNGGEKS